MKLGTMVPSFSTGDRLVEGETIRDWARSADEAGFEHLWSIDHLFKPSTYRSGTLDPLVTFSHAAAVTDNIKFGTSVLLLPLRRTVNVARRVQTLQHLSERQITLGLGAGYIPEQFEATGVPMKERSHRFSEGMEVLDQLFEGETSYRGEFHSFENVRIDPVTEPSPRLLAGGDSNVDECGDRYIPKPILERIMTASGWIAPPSTPDKLRTEWDIVSRFASSRGIDPDSIDRVLLQYIHLVDSDDATVVESEQQRAFEQMFSPSRGFDHARQNCLTGATEEILEMLDSYQDLGFDEVILGPVSGEPDELEKQMRLLERDILPEFE